jgi:hypothetical protein
VAIEARLGFRCRQGPPTRVSRVRLPPAERACGGDPGVAREFLPLSHLSGGGRVGGLAPVGQSFRQGWQLCVKNAASLGWIVTT